MRHLPIVLLILCGWLTSQGQTRLTNGIDLPSWAVSLAAVQGTACTCRAGSVQYGSTATTPITAQCQPLDDSLPALEPDPTYRCGCGAFANNLTCWQAGSSYSQTLPNVDTTACDSINVTSTSTSDSATTAPPCLDANGNSCGSNPGMQTFTTRSYTRDLVSLSCSVTVLRVQCTTPACAPGPVNCLLGAYTDWSKCLLSPVGTPYKFRYKPVIHDGSNGGTPCPDLASRYEETTCSDTELIPLPCSYTNTSLRSACSAPCGAATYTLTVYNVSLISKTECDVPDSEEVLSSSTLPCTTNLPCADLAQTTPINITCNYSGNTGFRDADVEWLSVTFGASANVSTNMTTTRLGRSFAVYHSRSKRPFSVVASQTALSGSTVTLKMASYGLDMEGSTGHPLELAYIPPDFENTTLLVNGYPLIAFVCVPTDSSPPVVVESLFDNGTALVYFSEDVRACANSSTTIPYASMGLSGISATSNLTRYNERVWYFTYTGFPVSTVTMSPTAGTFCDLRSNQNVVPSTPVTFLNRSLERAYWTMYTPGEHSSKLYTNDSTGLIDTAVIVSMLPFLRTAVQSSFPLMFGLIIYDSYFNTSISNYALLLPDKVSFESDESTVNTIIVRFRTGFVPNQGYYLGYGVQFPAASPQIGILFRLGVDFTGFALPPGLPAPLYGQLPDTSLLDRSIPRLQSAIAAVGQSYVNVTFTHPRQVGNFSLYEFEFTGPIVPAEISAVYGFITVQIATASPITFSDLLQSRVSFDGYIQYDTESELYRNEVWKEFINITNVDPKRPSVLYAEVKHVGSGFFFDELIFYLDEIVYESDSGLSATVSSPGNNMTVTVVACAVYNTMVGCDVTVSCDLSDCAYTRSDNVAVTLEGLVDANGNEMNPYSSVLVYDKAAPSLKMAILSPNGTSIVFWFSEAIHAAFDISDYQLTPKPISCAQTSSVSVECNYGRVLGADQKITFGVASSIVDIYGNSMRPVQDLPVLPNALVVIQNRCENILGLPDVWLYTFFPQALIGWTFLVFMFAAIVIHQIKKCKDRQSQQYDQVVTFKSKGKK